MDKRISSAAINALIEALTNIYWYKAELRSFIMHTVSDPSILSKLNWEDYKRNIVSRLVNFLASHQETYQNDLLRLMNEVCKMTDFTHLERIEDGKEKVQKAKKSVSALNKLTASHRNIVEEEKKAEERRKKAFKKSLKNQGVQKKLNDIKKGFYKLVSSTDPQSRGFQLEKIIKELFSLFDLDPKASFRITGEQIDGAFTFNNLDYLFEGKWQQDPVGIQDLDGSVVN